MSNGLEPILVIAAVGVPITVVAVLGLGWVESWSDRRRNARYARTLQQERRDRQMNRHI